MRSDIVTHLYLSLGPALTRVLAIGLPVALAGLLLNARAYATTNTLAKAPPPGIDVISPELVRLQHLNSSNGLSQASVQAIVQDAQGFIWLGTEDGLNRFDGENIQVYRHNTPDQPGAKLLSDTIHALCIATDNKLWIGHFDGGATAIDLVDEHSQRFSAGTTFPAGRVNHCLAEADGQLWFAVDGALVGRRSDGQWQRWPLPVNPSDSAHEREPGHDQAQGIADGDRLLQILRWQDQLLVLSAKTLWRLTGQGLQAQALAPSPATGAATGPAPGFWPGKLQVALAAGDSLLLGFDGAGLWRWQPKTKELRPEHPLLAKTRISSLLSAENGELWLGTFDAGVYRLNLVSGKLSQITPSSAEHGLHDSQIRTLYQSEDGVIWIGTWIGGLHYFDPAATFIPALDLSQTLSALASGPLPGPAPSVRAILSEAEQTWLALDNFGVLRLGHDGSRSHYRHQPTRSDSLTPANIRAFLRARDGRLWLAHENGLSLHLGFDRFSEQSLSASTGKLMALAEDNSANANGDLLLASFESGLWRYNPQTSAAQPVPLQECGQRLTALQPHLTGWLIASDDAGLCYWDGKQANRNLLPRGYSAWAIKVIDEQIWVGSYGSYLLRIDTNGKVQRFDQNNGISNAVIYCIADDAQGLLWLSSNAGLFRFNPHTGRARQYGLEAGLRDNEFNSGACTKAEDGKLWFGNIKGVQVFEPQHIQYNQHPPRSLLTAIRVNQQDWPNSKSGTGILELPAGTHSLSLHFAAAHFGEARHNRFRYRLLGLSDEWIDAEPKQRQVNYGELRPGRYTFELLALSSDGVIERSALQRQIAITPAWWQSTSAKLLYGLLFLLTLYLLGRWRHGLDSRKQARLLLLEQEVAKRTAELQAKAEQLGQVNLQLQAANNQLEALALTDHLTGLGNRRLLERYLEKDVPMILRHYELPRAAHQEPADMAFFLVDIDHFKSINDHFGHSVGDQVLVAICQRLQSIGREHDYLIRLGGEEILLVSRFIDRRFTAAIAARICSVIGTEPFTVSAGGQISVTASVGYAIFPLHTAEPNCYNAEQVLRIADCALYAAKYSGRQQWVGVTEAIFERPDMLLARLREHGGDCVREGTVTVFAQNDPLQLQWQPGQR